MGIMHFLFRLLVKILFGPWFYIEKISINLSPRLTIISISALVLLLLICRFFSSRITSKFIHTTLKVFFGLFEASILGSVANFTVTRFNGNKMPVATGYFKDLLCYAGEYYDTGRVYVGPESRLVWLSDYIHSSNLAVTRFLYPDGFYLSPGDLMMDSVILFTYWLLLVLIVWSTVAWIRHKYFSSKRIF